MHLGHDGRTCSASLNCLKTLTVLDTTGFHSAKVCVDGENAKTLPLWVRLLRAEFWPASYDNPQTAFTFECLNCGYHLNLQGKLTLYDYYETLVSLTDNTGVKRPKVSSHLLLLSMSLYWVIYSLRVVMMNFISRCNVGETSNFWRDLDVAIARTALTQPPVVIWLWIVRLVCSRVRTCQRISKMPQTLYREFKSHMTNINTEHPHQVALCTNAVARCQLPPQTEGKGPRQRCIARRLGILC